ncbi:MAG TPA: hypothetical protein VF456_02775 [Vicinamibacterales bacterium]
MKRAILEIVMPLCLLIIPASNASLYASLQSSPSAISIEHRPLSSTVWATIAVNNQGTELAVLWRGRPGWYLGRPRAEHAGGNSQSFNVSLQYGAATVDLSLDRRRREVKTGTIKTMLPPGTNTILIDHVDEPGSMTISGFTTLQLTATMTNPELAAALDQSSTAALFLQCDQGTDRFARVVCGQMFGQR